MRLVIFPSLHPSADLLAFVFNVQSFCIPFCWQHALATWDQVIITYNRFPEILSWRRGKRQGTEGTFLLWLLGANFDEAYGGHIGFQIN